MRKSTVIYGVGLFLAGIIGNEIYRRHVIKHELQLAFVINRQIETLNKNKPHNEG